MDQKKLEKMSRADDALSKGLGFLGVYVCKLNVC